MALSPAGSRPSRYFRLGLTAGIGFVLLMCLACSGGVAFWAVTPGYAGAQLSQVSQLEFASGQCVDQRGTISSGPAFNFSRIFMSEDNAFNIANWFMQRGWSPVNRITGRGSFLVPLSSPKYDVMIGRVVVYSGLAVTRVADDSTRIMMRSSVVFCSW
jgi:hypothetical protein